MIEKKENWFFYLCFFSSGPFFAKKGTRIFFLDFGKMN